MQISVSRSGIYFPFLHKVNTKFNFSIVHKKCAGLADRDYGRMGSVALTTRHPPISKKFALTSPTSGGRSVIIVWSRTQATEFVCLFVCLHMKGVSCLQRRQHLLQSSLICFPINNSSFFKYVHICVYNSIIFPCLK
jgi:hypothetical protein